MKPKTTIVLVVLLAVVIAGYLLTTRSAPPAGPGATPTPDRLLDLDPSSVQTIRVERGDRAYALERIDGAWTQTKPTRFGVESFRVEDLLNAAADMEIVESFTPGDGDRPTLDELDLAPPAATVELDDATLHLGRVTIGGRAYATVAGTDTVAVVPDRLHRFVADTSVNDLRARTLDGVSASGLERLDIAWRPPAAGDAASEEAAPTRFSLVKQDGEWYLGEPAANRADRTTVADYARRLAGLRIDGFIDDDAELAAFGLDAPRETYTAQQLARNVPGDDPTQAPPRLGTLRVGNTADFAGDLRYATWTVGDTPSTLVFTLNDADLADLRRSPDDFRDPNLMALDPAAITSVTLSGPAVAPITVLRDGAAFAFAATDDTPPPAYGVDSQIASDWLAAIAGMTSDAFAPRPPSDATPDATLAIAATTQDEPIVVRLFRETNENVDDGQAAEPGWLAVVADESTARLLTDSEIEAIAIQPLALRNRDVLDLKPDEIRSFTIAAPGWKGLTARRNDGDEGWPTTRGLQGLLDDGTDSQAPTDSVDPAQKWVAYDGTPLRDEAIDRLIAALATLRVTGWQGYEDERDAELDARLSIAIADAESPERMRLATMRFNPGTGEADWLNPPGGPATEARQIGSPVTVMRLPASVLDRLTAELRDPVLLYFPVDHLARVTMMRNGETLTIERPAIGAVVASGDLAEAFDMGRANRLLETLAGLEAERFAPTPAPEGVTEALAEWQIMLDDGTTRRLAAYRDPADPTRTLWCTASDGDTRWFTLTVADANALGLPTDEAAADDDFK